MTDEMSIKMLHYTATNMMNRDTNEIKWDEEFIGNQMMTAALLNDFTLINADMVHHAINK